MISAKKRRELDKLAEAYEVEEAKKILIFDIETAPMEFYAWSTGKTYLSPAQIKEDWSVFCWAAKWFGESDIMFECAWEHSPYPREDKEVCRILHRLFDEADIVVAHNGKGFDVKKMNARFLYHGFGPPKPYKIVDTLLIARGNFKFSSNKLDELGKVLGVGRKVPHQGLDLWLDILNQNPESQETMKKYNIGDVVLLEHVYLLLRAWDKRHPNVNLDFEVSRCSVCACDKLRQSGEVYTPVNSYCAYQCIKCGHWMRGTTSTRTKEERARIGRNVV